MSIDVSYTTAEQWLVLQAIYDHFRAHANWPTFISIDRPLRREHYIDTGAIVVSMPEALMAPPRPGKLRPVAADELRLTLLGIAHCEGGSGDIERFVRLLRWLAEQEMAYEPGPGSAETMPRVTSRDVAAHLRLEDDDLAVARLYAMLQLDHWGLGGSGSNDDSWYVWLGPDIWRFRDVHSVEDVVAAREAWLAEGRPPITKASEPVPTWYYHVRLSVNEQRRRNRYWLDLTDEALESQILAPYSEGRAIVDDGVITKVGDITQIQIIRTEQHPENCPGAPLPMQALSTLEMTLGAA